MKPTITIYSDVFPSKRNRKRTYWLPVILLLFVGVLTIGAVV